MCWGFNSLLVFFVVLTRKETTVATAITKPELSVSVTIKINEIEARALDALAGYGDDEFIKMFYKNLGKSYMQPYEEGLRSFLDSIRSAVSPALNHIDAARQFIRETKAQ